MLGLRLRKGGAGTRSFAVELWLVAAWAAFAVLPWHGVEGGLVAILTGHARPVQLTSALLLALGGAPGPWMLLVLLGPATAAVIRQSPRLLVTAGLLGIAWVAFDGFILSGRSTIGAALFGPPALDAPRASLGWGALIFVLSASMIASFGWARVGWLRGDVFIIGALMLVCGSIFIFVGYPVICILLSAFKQDGAIALSAFVARLSDNSIWGLACLRVGHAGSHGTRCSWRRWSGC